MVGELAETAAIRSKTARLRVAAQLHDVGKVGIAAEILEKSERLTEEERRELERHVELGVDIFTNAEAPRSSSRSCATTTSAGTDRVSGRLRATRSRWARA